ncbi:MAG: NAD(P)H-hydrate dehydratase [Bacillota bacterium]|nr:NAD(P)H-hydrate dehydratase [Bacillota bacterium]
MLIIAGIVPLTDLPLVTGKINQNNDQLVLDGHLLPGGQGTAAMISAALEITEYMGLEAPYTVLAGDTGSGKGSRLIYQYLIDHLHELQPEVLALHYWMPDLALMQELCNVIKQCKQHPIMIADAASMYTAKACGLATEFDLFTPDSSEIAFLADPDALHPAYINKHLFQSDTDRHPELIEMAYKNQSASSVLLVKGKQDLIADKNGIITSIDGPDVPAMECIGGTGDSITGMCAALAYSKMPIERAAITSAIVNRIAGQMARVNPASGIKELVKQIPAALTQTLHEKQKEVL